MTCPHNSELVAHCRECVSEIVTERNRLRVERDELEAQRDAFGQKAQQLQERVRDLEDVLDAVDRWAGKRPVRRKVTAEHGASPQVCAGCGEPASARPLHWKVRGAWVCMECFGRERRGPCSVCGAADHTASMHAGEDYG